MTSKNPTMSHFFSRRVLYRCNHPTEWVQTLNDEVLATAIIDRLLYRCEVIKLAGTSYRLENRKTIFPSESTVDGKQLRKAASKTIERPSINSNK